MTALSPLLAYIPFLDPINIESWWYFTLLPLAFGTAVTYKAVRLRTFEGYWKQVRNMTALIVFYIVSFGVLTLLFVTQIMPRVAVR